MLHWYHLLQLTREERTRTSSAHSQLIAGRGGSPTASLPQQQRRKLFWLGLAEAVPLIAGAIFSINTDSKLQAVIAALVAIVLTAIISWCLRHQVPLTRIELTQTKTHDQFSREATCQA